MRHATRKRRSNRGVLVIVGVAIVAAVVAVGALAFSQQPIEKPFEKSLEEDSAGSATELALTSEDFNGEEALAISTKYCNLYYPVDFEEVLKVEKSSTGNSEAVAFYAMLSDEESVLLFEVCFGEADGAKIGEFAGSEGAVPVYLIVEDIVPDESWSSAQVDLLLGMQEGLNVVVSSLEANESFRSVSN